MLPVVSCAELMVARNSIVWARLIDEPRVHKAPAKNRLRNKLVFMGRELKSAVPRKFSGTKGMKRPDLL
jgi:hypothetical protein